MPSPERDSGQFSWGKNFVLGARSRLRDFFHLELKKYNTQRMMMHFQRVNIP